MWNDACAQVEDNCTVWNNACSGSRCSMGRCVGHECRWSGTIIALVLEAGWNDYCTGPRKHERMYACQVSIQNCLLKNALPTIGISYDFNELIDHETLCSFPGTGNVYVSSHIMFYHIGRCSPAQKSDATEHSQSVPVDLIMTT